MTAIQNFFQNLLYQIPKIGISDIIDILVVSFLIYTVLRLVRSSSAARVAWTVLVLLIATWLTSVFDLYACNWILNKILELGFISLVVIFQPEIRRAMERFGGKFFLNLVDPASKKSVEESAIEATVSACEIMSKERVGVLLIFERSVSLEEYFKTGTLIDAKVTEQLLAEILCSESGTRKNVGKRAYRILLNQLDGSREKGAAEQTAKWIDQWSQKNGKETVTIAASCYLYTKD